MSVNRSACLRLGVVLGALLLLAGACASPSKFGKIEDVLATGVGVMPFSEAKEMWGPPAGVSEGEGVFTAVWTSESLGGMLSEKLYLTFDKKKEILRAYHYVQKPSD